MVFYSHHHSLYSHNSYYSHCGKSKGAQSMERRTPIKGRLPDLATHPPMVAKLAFEAEA